MRGMVGAVAVLVVVISLLTPSVCCFLNGECQAIKDGFTYFLANLGQVVILMNEVKISRKVCGVSRPRTHLRVADKPRLQ